jgi:hypothetical protein
LLKVSTYNGKQYYNPIVGGTLSRVSVDELDTLIDKPKAD